MSRFKIQRVFKTEKEFGGDEAAIRLLIDGNQVAEYGDWYHDNGKYKILGFIAGYCFAKNIEWDGKYDSEEIADPNVY